MAPIVVHHHGDLAVSGVLSVHFVGMFAFMPLIGVIIDRIGRRRGLVAAVALSATGVLVGALSTQPVVFGFGLFLVGLGWAVSYLGATAIVSDVTDPLPHGSGGHQRGMNATGWEEQGANLWKNRGTQCRNGC